eukprot:Sdes_comp20387_c0_seq1m14301
MVGSLMASSDDVSEPVVFKPSKVDELKEACCKVVRNARREDPGIQKSADINSYSPNYSDHNNESSHEIYSDSSASSTNTISGTAVPSLGSPLLDFELGCESSLNECKGSENLAPLQVANEVNPLSPSVPSLPQSPGIESILFKTASVGDDSIMENAEKLDFDLYQSDGDCVTSDIFGVEMFPDICKASNLSTMPGEPILNEFENSFSKNTPSEMVSSNHSYTKNDIISDILDGVHLNLETSGEDPLFSLSASNHSFLESIPVCSESDICNYMNPPEEVERFKSEIAEIRSLCWNIEKEFRQLRKELFLQKRSHIHSHLQSKKPSEEVPETHNNPGLSCPSAVDSLTPRSTSECDPPHSSFALHSPKSSLQSQEDYGPDAVAPFKTSFFEPSELSATNRSALREHPPRVEETSFNPEVVSFLNTCRSDMDSDATVLSDTEDEPIYDPPLCTPDRNWLLERQDLAWRWSWLQIQMKSLDKKIEDQSRVCEEFCQRKKAYEYDSERNGSARSNPLLYCKRNSNSIKRVTNFGGNIKYCEKSLRGRVSLLCHHFHPVLSFIKDIPAELLFRFHVDSVSASTNALKCKKLKGASLGRSSPNTRKLSKKLKKKKMQGSLETFDHFASENSITGMDEICDKSFQNNHPSRIGGSPSQSLKRTSRSSSGTSEQDPERKKKKNASSRNSIGNAVKPDIVAATKKRKSYNPFDIDNIVIPKSMVATRVEKVAVKDILTPEWRIASQSILQDQLLRNGIENTLDEAYLSRHLKFELQEKKRFAVLDKQKCEIIDPAHKRKSLIGTAKFTNPHFHEKTSSGFPPRKFPLSPLEEEKIQAITEVLIPILSDLIEQPSPSCQFPDVASSAPAHNFLPPVSSINSTLSSENGSIRVAPESIKHLSNTWTKKKKPLRHKRSRPMSISSNHSEADSLIDVGDPSDSFSSNQPLSCITDVC